MQRSMIFTLPIPPSVNHLYVNRKVGTGRGRIKSKKYRAWIKEADGYYIEQGLGRRKPITGSFRVTIIVAPSRRDIDGLLKAAIDWCVLRRLVPDDKHMTASSIMVDGELVRGFCQVLLTGLDDAT